MVSHTDREHPHIHVIVNIVDPETGKAHSLSFSRKKLSEWAENYERERGKIYCDQRVENNAKRAEGEYVKYQEPELDMKAQLNELYAQSDNGASFQASLAELGFTLAQGKRIVVVDSSGTIHSLSRQIDGAKAKDIRTKLADLELPDVDSVREQLASASQDNPAAAHERAQPDQAATEEHSDQRSKPQQPSGLAEVFDRDRQDRDSQESIIDAAIKQVRESEQRDRADKDRRNLPSKRRDI